MSKTINVFGNNKIFAVFLVESSKIFDQNTVLAKITAETLCMEITKTDSIAS